MSDKDKMVKDLKDISKTARQASQWCQRWTSDNEDIKKKLENISLRLLHIANEIDNL